MKDVFVTFMILFLWPALSLLSKDKPTITASPSTLSDSESKSLDDLDSSVKSAGDEVQNKGILFQNANIAYQSAVNALTSKQLQRSEALRNLEREKCKQKESLSKTNKGWICGMPDYNIPPVEVKK